MTGFDIFFIVVAVVDLLLVAAMGAAAYMMKQKMTEGRGRVQPAVSEAKALMSTGKAIARDAKRYGTAIGGRVKGVTELVKQRVETTKQIAEELKPAKQTPAVAREATTDLVEAAKTVGSMASGIGRVKEKAQAAARAARRP